MNLLIVECFSGGGHADTQLSSSILSEAYAMLRVLIADTKAAGHTVTTFMDYRLKEFNPPNQADHTVTITSPDQLYEKLRELSSAFDAVYVIGPESDQTLEKMVKTVETAGGYSLNCSSDSIKQVSNKLTFYETAKKCGVTVPETVVLSIHEKADTVKRLTKPLGYPMVFKPVDGVGCGGLSVVTHETGIEAAIHKVARESQSAQFVAQNLVKGQPASVCVFSTGCKAVAVSLNKQFVALGSPHEESRYLGGVVPFEHPLKRAALSAAEKVVSSQKGLRGYVGVDMVLTKDEPVVVEVNPRLTVSYIGLSKVLNFNPAQALIEAVTKQKRPMNNETTGYAYFSKIETPSNTEFFAQTANNKNLVVPPFPFEQNKPAYALALGTSNSLRGAQSKVTRTKNSLLKLRGR
ncbi:MAG: ATP-grasp domain-containing protein [Candidatus Bathyarchaeia archaeon]